MPPTTTATSATAASFTGQHNDNHRLPSKRKLDDYAPSLDDDDDEDSDFSDLVSVRMRRDESLAVHSSSNGQNNQNGNGASNINQSTDNLDNSRVSNANSSSSASSQYRACSSSSSSSSPLQFFVRMMGDGRNLVIQANSADTVKSLHERIFMITNIPVIEQRLVYKGRQLQWEQSLAACSIENDSGLHLVGRMRSTRHPRTCQLVNDMVSFIYKLCKGVVCHPYASKHIKELMNEFFTLTPKDDNDDAFGHLQVFTSISAPTALVALYVSTTKGNKDIAESSIKHFFDSCRISLPKPLHTYCAPIVLEFCKLLRKVADDDPLYICCRGALGSLLENAGTSRTKYCYGVGGEDVKGLIFMQEIFPFVAELASRLSKDLVSSVESPVNVGPPLRDVRDFSAFLLPLHASITDLVGCQGPFSMPFSQSDFSHPLYEEEIRQLYAIFNDLLDKMDKCLEKMEDSLPSKLNGESEPAFIGWSNYLAILKALSIIAKMYEDGDHKFLTVLKLRKASVHALIMRYTRRTEDHQWLLQHKEVTNFESRRHLAMMMFPEVKEDYEELHEMLIDRTQLLAESFEYIAHAEAEALHGGLFMEFKNEEATGPGVLREWFLLVAQATFDPQKALFVACPNDRRRFFPNPTSKVDPLHLEYFTFSGRMIALALMHKVQVGIVLDRVFFLQLAGMHVSLEDIRDADPFMYSSCRQILEMDPAFIDSDALGLTFVREVEELGSRKVVELCSGGKKIVVNSNNRERYVNFLIRHCFVTSISEQISHFARGFGDILCNSGLQSFFFQSLELEDLDWMLYGSGSVICIEDWKAHTEYNGYKETDPQISWFWTIVGGMSAEQKKNLLFFWTSVRYLPVEGFRGLASRLHIYRSTEPQNRLPSSHTCFYRLCFPPYESMAIMQDRLRVITQEHIGSSFGTW